MEYGAIDLHKRFSQIRIVDAAGAAVFEDRIATTRVRRFRCCARCCGKKGSGSPVGPPRPCWRGSSG